MPKYYFKFPPEEIYGLKCFETLKLVCKLQKSLKKKDAYERIWREVMVDVASKHLNSFEQEERVACRELWFALKKK